MWEWRGTLRVLRAETWLTVYCTIAWWYTTIKWSSYQGFGGWHEEKCTENVVERMLEMEIKIELIKRENANAATRSIIYQNLKNLRKVKFFWKFHFLFDFPFIFEIFLKRHSTSPPCGNLVDGLPHDCHTEPQWIGLTLDPIVGFRFLMMLYIMSY